MKNKLLAVLAVAVGLLVAGPIFAHHSTSIYDAKKVTTLQGTVTRFAFINPHVQIMIDVEKDNGEIEKWTGVSRPPNALRRAGWTNSTIKPGDRITMGGNPIKDGRTILSVQTIVMPNGETLPMRSID